MTLKEINRAIQEKAPNVNLYKGQGYLYYVYDDNAKVHETHSVYVPFIYMQSAKRWIEDGLEFAAHTEKMVAERVAEGDAHASFVGGVMGDFRSRNPRPATPVEPLEINPEDYDLFLKAKS